MSEDNLEEKDRKDVRRERREKMDGMKMGGRRKGTEERGKD